jgi:carboxyl-terminal processing protease
MSILKKLSLAMLFMVLATTGAWSENTSGNHFDLSKNLDIFNSLFRELDAYYVDTINYQKAITSGINDMLSDLDPYTVYFPEEQTDFLKELTTGEYAGVGAEIQQRNGQVIITDPFQDKPAQQAGLKAGDILLELDGISLKGKTSLEVSNLLKGQPQTIVKLKIQRPGVEKPININVMREKIAINPVVYYGTLKNNVGYIMLSGFTENASDEMQQALLDLKNRHVKAMVIDLRNNLGGIIDEAVKMVGFFVPKGTVVVTTRGKLKQWDKTYRTQSEPILTTMPMAILVDENTASAAEILSGTLQDLDRAVIVGTRTFGKGLVQSIRELPYNGHLKVTIAKYYIPSGRCIQAINYAERNDDGSPMRVPDSLTHVFKTADGRFVRDGGGIRPDVAVNDSAQLNITYYLMNQNVIFDFATQYALKHSNIEEPEKFNITDSDYDSFKQYVKDQHFHYTLQSETLLKKLMATANIEGYANLASTDFKSLQSILTPNIDKDMNLFKNDIENLINGEIVKRYYYQKGVVRYSLQHDKTLDKAMNVIDNNTEYNKLLENQN